MIILLISFILDTIFPNMFKEVMPLFMIAGVTIISSKYEEGKRTYIVLIILGILYDLFNTNLLFFHGAFFPIMYFFFNLLFNNRDNFFLMLMFYYVSIMFKFVFMMIFSITSNVDYLHLVKLIFRCLPLNTFYFIIMYLLFIKIKSLIKHTNKKHSY